MRSTNTDRYDQQHQHAIRAAASVFAAKGFHGASTKDIAERMGIKQGSLYYVHRMDDIAKSDQPFEAKLIATITSHLSSYREKNEALKVHNDERLYLPAEKRTKLKRLGTRYRQNLEEIFEEGVRSGVLRDSLDCHFAAQSVIGICNAWGDLIVRDPQLDLFDVIQKCTDLLLNGFRERRKTQREN
jgi:DNA-binding transcriptional regulator YbjK